MRRMISILIAIAILMIGQAVVGEKKDCTLPAQECLDRMVTHMVSAGIVGVEGDLDEATGGLQITDFIEGTNAEDAGVKTGDILLTINGIALSDKEAYESSASSRTIGQNATIAVLRDDAELAMNLVLVEIPYEMIEREIGHHMARYHVQADLEKAKAKRKTKTKTKTKAKRKTKAKA